LRVTSVARLNQPSTRICKILANCEHALSDRKESNGSNKISLLVNLARFEPALSEYNWSNGSNKNPPRSGNFCWFAQAGVSCTAREGIGSGVWLGKRESSCRSPWTKATAPSRLIAPMKSFAPAKIIAIQIVRDRRLGNPDPRKADRRLSVYSLEPLR